MDSTVIFTHIPKTAGRTLEMILDRQYPDRTIYSIYGYSGSIQENVETLINLSEEHKKQFKLIKGHYQFGLHQFLPQPTVYLTFLRNPIKRVISHYNYVSRDKSHPLYHLIHDKKMGVKEYVESGLSIELNNGQTRLLSGREHDYKFGETPNSLLDMAINNMEKHFILVGLVENLEQSLLLMKQVLAYSDVRYVSQNISKNSPAQASISQETLEIIKRYNELDLKLYDYAQRKFNQLLEQNQSFLDKELPKFYKQNRQYQWWGRLNLLTKSVNRKFMSVFG